MSLYHVQKFLFELNRDEAMQRELLADPSALVDRKIGEGFQLTDEEVRALTEPDVGLLYHLGVNGQILMHFAALHQIEWQDYLQRMRDGITAHGPVREGVYAMTGFAGVSPVSSSGLDPAPSASEPYENTTDQSESKET